MMRLAQEFRRLPGVTKRRREPLVCEDLRRFTLIECFDPILESGGTAILLNHLYRLLFNFGINDSTRSMWLN